MPELGGNAMDAGSKSSVDRGPPRDETLRVMYVRLPAWLYWQAKRAAEFEACSLNAWAVDAIRDRSAQHGE